jgi:hypothetical protein
LFCITSASNSIRFGFSETLYFIYVVQRHRMMQSVMSAIPNMIIIIIIIIKTFLKQMFSSVVNIYI